MNGRSARLSYDPEWKANFFGPQYIYPTGYKFCEQFIAAHTGLTSV